MLRNVPNASPRCCLSYTKWIKSHYVIEAHYPPRNPINWNNIQQTFAQCCMDAGVEWLCSYLSLDRTRLIHELDAADTAALGIVQQKIDISPKQIWFAHRLRSS